MYTLINNCRGYKCCLVDNHTQSTRDNNSLLKTMFKNIFLISTLINEMENDKYCKKGSFYKKSDTF